MTSSIQTVAIIGSGVIGSGWAARCLAHGLDVVAFDPAPDGEAKIRAAIANAWPALEKAGLANGASPSRLTYVSSVAEAVKNADFVQENAPEREELKQKLLAEIDAAAKPDLSARPLSFFTTPIFDLQLSHRAGCNPPSLARTLGADWRYRLGPMAGPAGW